MARHALEERPYDPPPPPRMSFASIQFAGWLGWSTGLVCALLGAAVAFIVMPAALAGHRDASIMGGTLFLGGWLAMLAGGQALSALQSRPEVVTRWLYSTVFGLGIASFTVAIAGLRGGTAYLQQIGELASGTQWLLGICVLPVASLLIVSAITVLRGGVLSRVEPVKVRVGSPRPHAGRWVRRVGGAALIVLSGSLWWQGRPVATPNLQGTTAKGETLEHWYQQWRKSGHTRGVEAFADAGKAGTDAAVAICGELLSPRHRSRANRLRAVRSSVSGMPSPFPPLKSLRLELDVSEPVVRVLSRNCLTDDAAAAMLKRVVTEHDSPPIRTRAFVALVEGSRVEGAESAAWIRELLTRGPDPSLQTLLELRLTELGG